MKDEHAKRTHVIRWQALGYEVVWEEDENMQPVSRNATLEDAIQDFTDTFQTKKEACTFMKGIIEDIGWIDPHKRKIPALLSMDYEEVTIHDRADINLCIQEMCKEQGVPIEGEISKEERNW